MEINPAYDGEVNSGNTGVPSDPPAESTPKPLRPVKSSPSELLPSTGALVGGSTAPRPKSASSPFSFLKKWTRTEASRSVSDGETNPREVSPADNTKREEHLRWTSPYVDTDKVCGFEEELQALESFVRRENDQGFRAVAVVGDGGIGKTTLCQLLFNEKGIKEEFVPRIWVSNSRLPDEDENKDLKTTIVRRMLTQIGEDETDDMELDQLMALLHRNLWGKKYLIIVDDARDAGGWYDNLGAVPNMDDEWKKRLAYGLPKGSGGRVVVTVRNEEVARKMVGEHNLQKVMPLSNLEYCWSIFEESVGQGLDEAMKKEVYDKSNGRPLAVKVMGQIMKEQLYEISRDRIDRTATA